MSSAIYGNVLNSTGSIIPLIWDSINKGYELTLYSEEMTRFMIDIEDAMNLIELGLKVDGYNVIPNLRSFLVKDLFEIYADKFGLKYKKGTPRISEKIHEIMVSKEEAPRTFYNKVDDTYYMHYKEVFDNSLNDEFSSYETTVSKQELTKILNHYNFFKP